MSDTASYVGVSSLGDLQNGGAFISYVKKTHKRDGLKKAHPYEVDKSGKSFRDRTKIAIEKRKKEKQLPETRLPKARRNERLTFRGHE